MEGFAMFVRRLAWYGLAVFVLMSPVWYSFPPDPINPTAFGQIQPGMTLSEVNAILGGREGWPPHCGVGIDWERLPLSWPGRSACITVYIDARSDAPSAARGDIPNYHRDPAGYRVVGKEYGPSYGQVTWSWLKWRLGR
jgi:hypothetical protein